jgi:hypothetical protein
MPLRRPRPAPAPTDTHAVEPEDFTPFDTPSTAVVLQAEEPYPEIAPVPVRLVNKVRVDQLPTELGITKTINVSSAAPEQLLPENKRRATINFWLVSGETVRVARTHDEALRDDSSIVIVANAGPFRFHWTDACWAMKRVGAASLLSIATEDWAR